MRRREFLAVAVGAACRPFAAAAQTGGTPRVGYFWPGALEPNVGVAGFRQGLAERGYVLGRSLILEERYAEGDLRRGPSMIAELLALPVDVLVTGDYAVIFAHSRTSTIPIVGVAADFVGVGLAAGLSHPGGNVTGLSLLSAEFSAKWLDLLKAAVPKLGRVAFLGGAAGPQQAEKARLDEVAPRLGVTLTQLDMWPANLDTSLAEITRDNYDGLIVADDILTEGLIPRLVALSAERRMPAIYGFSTAVRQGGLMAYSADVFEIWRELAGYVDRVLKGAKPGDLPIQQATAIKFGINLGVARTLGLDIAPTLLAAADEVID